MSTYSTNLRIELIGNGEQPGTWGSTTNSNLGTLIEQAITGWEAVTTVADKQALTRSDGGADQARNAVLDLDTTYTGEYQVFVPPVPKTYIIKNSNLSYGVRIYCSDSPGSVVPAGTYVLVPAGKTIPMYSDGTDIKISVDHLISPTLSNAELDGVTLSGTVSSSGAVLSGTFDASGSVLDTPTIDAATLNGGYTEQVYAISGTTPALSPTNGSIQTWTLSGNSTPTAGTWASGQSIMIMIDDGTNYTVDWASLSIAWKSGGGSAPALLTTGYTPIVLWKVASTIYGARVGDA